MKNSKIMIVEDDLIASAYLQKLLKKHNFTIAHTADNADDALRLCKEEEPTLILMDIMIKGPLSGCDLAIKIRAFNKDVIIIFLTAFSNEEMIESALDAKAYSYLLKPYRDIEIISTIKMALKENIIKDNNSLIICKNGYTFNTSLNQFSYNDEEVILSEKLFLLIKTLAKSRGSSVTYEQIASVIWGGSEEINLNTLRALIHRVKTQLPDLDLHKVNKIGYVLY